MNYPLRKAILDFVLKQDAKALADTLKEIYASYPKSVCDSLMNILGTHDTERILTVLGKQSAEVCGASGSELARKRLGDKEREAAKRKLMIAATLQYTVYGVPSLYYGDEAGLEGYRDPFCRMPYPWGREDAELLKLYKKLGTLRTENREIFANGIFEILAADNAIIAYTRKLGDDEIIVVANAGQFEAEYALQGEWEDLLGEQTYKNKINADSCVVLKKRI